MVGNDNLPVEDMTNEQILELIERERVQAPDPSVDEFWGAVFKTFAQALASDDEHINRHLAQADYFLQDAKKHACNTIHNIDKTSAILSILRAQKEQKRVFGPEEVDTVACWLRKIKEYLGECRDVQGVIMVANEHIGEAVKPMVGAHHHQSQLPQRG